MGYCKTIIINIEQFNPLDIYTVSIRVKSNVIDNPGINTPYTQIAIGSKVIFTDLPQNDYEARVVRTCATGGTSTSEWVDAIASICPVPVGFTISSTTSSSILTAWTGITGEVYEVNIDKALWIPAAAISAHTFSGLIASSVYEVRLRKVCVRFSNSLPVRLNAATGTGTPAFTTRIIRKDCEGNTFNGFLVRFQITSGLPATGSTLRISYTDYYGVVTIITSRVLIGGDTVTSVINALASAFVPQNVIINTVSGFASFDAWIKPQVTAVGSTLYCQDIPLTNPYSTTII